MAKASLLIVDSDNHLAQIMASFLNFCGFRVTHTARKREAIKKLSFQRYSAVFIDPDLKKETGDEILRAIADKSGLNSKTPVILLAGSLDFKIADDVIPTIKQIIPKPFTLEDLIGALKNVNVEK